jgi:Rieske 2Fe-2S family protein
VTIPFPSADRSPLTPDELASIRRPYRSAHLLPGRVFHDPAVLAWEMEHFFAKDWLVVGRAEQAPESGSYFLVDVAGENIVLVRGRDGELRAFYNVCRHRGTAVAEEPCGKVVRFQCPYHAWIYDLDGSLVRARHLEDLEDFDVKDFGLVPVRVAVWQGWVFLCLSDETPPLEEFLGDWIEHHAERDMTGLRRAGRLEYDVKANWKVIAENYSECYHCPGVHPLLNRLTPYDLGGDWFPTGPWKGGWMPLDEGYDTMSMDGSRNGRPLLPFTTPEDDRKILYHILWPNLIMSIHPDYVLTHHAWPIEPGLSKVHCDLYVTEETLAAGFSVSDALEFWNLTNEQDYRVCEMQQVGTASRSFTAGRYSNQEASVHAFDLMVADRYAMDGVRTQRGQRTGEGKVRTRARTGTGG